MKKTHSHEIRETEMMKKKNKKKRTTIKIIKFKDLQSVVQKKASWHTDKPERQNAFSNGHIFLFVLSLRVHDIARRLFLFLHRSRILTPALPFVYKHAHTYILAYTFSSPGHVSHLHFILSNKCHSYIYAESVLVCMCVRVPRVVAFHSQTIHYIAHTHSNTVCNSNTTPIYLNERQASVCRAHEFSFKHKN